MFIFGILSSQPFSIQRHSAVFMKRTGSGHESYRLFSARNGGKEKAGLSLLYDFSFSKTPGIPAFEKKESKLFQNTEHKQPICFYSQ